MIIQLMDRENRVIGQHGPLEIKVRVKDDYAQIVFNVPEMRCSAAGTVHSYLLCTEEGMPWYHITAQAPYEVECGSSVSIKELSITLDGPPLPKPRYSLDVNDSIMGM